MTYTTADKIAELKREIKLRVAVYPRLIRIGKLNYQDAARQTDILRAILDDYEFADQRMDRREA